MMEGEHYLRILYSIQNDDEDDSDVDDDEDDFNDVQDNDYDKGVTCCRAQCPEAICGWKEHAKCQHLMTMTMMIILSIRLIISICVLIVQHLMIDDDGNADDHDDDDDKTLVKN